MTIDYATRALLDKLRIIDETDNDCWLLEPIHVALESMDKLELYKKALYKACNGQEYLVKDFLEKARGEE